MSDTYSERLAEFVCGLSLGQIPAHVVDSARLSALDAIGVILAGHRTESAKAVVDLVSSWGGTDQSSIFGTNFRLPAHAAAFANGVAHHSVELDDHVTHTRSFNHPGVVSYPASYAVAEREHADGASLLTAAIAAYEVNSRLNAAVPIGTFNFDHGFHGTALTGSFGSAAAAAVLTGATPEELVNAFGICGSMSSGSYEFKSTGSWSKRFHAGWASQAGIMAMDLGRLGFKGPNTILEGRAGFYAIFARNTKPDLAVLDEGLGSHYEFDYIMYKPFSCAGVLHAPLTAMAKIFNDTEIDHRDIEEVDVATNSTVHKQMSEPRENKIAPRTTVDAQFSLQYAVAVFCRFRRALLSEFSDETIHDKDVLRIASVVNCIVDPEFDARFPAEENCSVKIKLRDGRELVGTTVHAKGSLGMPMTENELKDKFIALSSAALTPGKARQVIATIDDLPQLSDVSKLTELLEPEDS